MGEPILLLRLEGPLQSWGLRARWDVRDSAREPTKSGVIGLLAAALGYGRDDPRIAKELEEGLRMGVRVEREAGLLDDYHTISGFLPMADRGYKASANKRAAKLEALLRDPDAEPYTVQSNRRYLTDASFLVALGASPSASSGLIDRCGDALRRPCWPLYLGRRACIPSRPVLEAITTQYASIEDALARHPWSCLGANAELRIGRDGASERLRIVVEDPRGAPRSDRRRTGDARLFGRRLVREGTVVIPKPSAEGK